MMADPTRHQRAREGLDDCLQRLVAHPDVAHATFAVRRGDGSFTWRGALGEARPDGTPMTVDTTYFVASIDKLVTATAVFLLAERGSLDLDAPMLAYLPAELGAGLHVMGGTDRTDQVTVRHLLSHTSGLPDYFEGKRRDGGTLAADLFSGHDRAYGLAQVLAWARDEMHPAFAPGADGRALYSDTNFYLLAEIVARTTGDSLDTALARRITGPLGLTGTAFFKPGMAALPLRLGARVIEVPQALTSMPGDGGAVSCLVDLARFTRAFFAGGLFPASFLDDLQPWRRVFFPLRAGTGVLRFAVPRWLPPFRRGLEFIGHSGISGAIAFACPARGRIIVGTVNQLQDRGRPYRMMIKAALA